MVREVLRFFNGGLRWEVQCDYKIPTMQTSQSPSLRTMVARISADDIVIYANGALASYLKVRKRDLIGSPLEVVGKRCKGEISSCFSRPETGRSSNHLVTDDEGRVFEVKVYSDGGVLDIVLDEVTNADLIGRELRDSSGTPFESLSEDELRTTRHPERRYLTISYTKLLGVAQLTERLAPMEVRLMVNSFVEEASDAVFESGCTVGETTGDSILGIFGAPRYYTDHPLRAILAACDQMRKAAQLHAGFYREGKELPPNTCGIWTGDVLVGTLGNSAWHHYTALGLPVELAQKLAELARPGEVLLPEHTLTHLLRVLPAGWEHVRAESEYEPDLSDFQWAGDDIAPVAEHLRKVVYLVGRGVQEHADQVELYFNYLWALKIPGRDQYVPILSVTRPMEVGDSIELSEDNVVTTQIAQTLGKYKLISVIGSGGMGKVWRGVDRFGNAVAIKVLHSGESVTDATLKRFRREAEIMARLPHRNICRVFEMNEFDGIQYLAMEFVDGLTLSDLLYEKADSDVATVTTKVDLKSLIHSIRSGRSSRETAMTQGDESLEAESAVRPKKSRILPVEQTLSIFLKVCEAVQFAHEHGVLHRDLKPGNILLREDGEPLVADFGLAKLNTADATQSLSVSGHVVGTLENMSPEQAESSKTVDERADVYALGTILYQMLTGRRHFEATGNIVVDAQALRIHEPVRPRALNSHIDLDLEIITLKALRNDPVERYRSVSALLADIERYRRGEAISARPVTPWELFQKLVERNRGVSAAIAGALAIFVIGTILAFYLQSLRLSESTRLRKEAMDAKAEAQAKAALAETKNKEAQDEKAKAEGQAKIAEDNKAYAVDQYNKAIEALDKLNKAMDDVKAARTEVVEATQRGDKSEAEKKAAEEREKAALEALNEQKKEQAKFADNNEMRPGPLRRAFRTGQGEPQPFGSAGPSMEAQESFNTAMEIFNLGMLQNASGDEGVNQLVKAMDAVSKTLVASPDFLPAIMLKGRLHLCLMEYDQAAACFAAGAKLVASGAPPMPNDNPVAMYQMMSQVTSTLGDRTTKVLQALHEAGSQQNELTAGILKQVSTKAKKNAFAATQSNPLGRGSSVSEVTLSLLEKNGPDTQISVKTNPDGKPAVIIWNTKGLAEFKDLSPLKQIDPSSVAVVGAKAIDWASLKALRSLASLDLSKSDLSTGFPGGFPNPFARLRSLTLADSGLPNLEFVRGLVLLEALDVSNTNVTDLAPLVACTRLRELNIGNLNPSNLLLLFKVPLESLVLSPLLITDTASLNQLKLLRGVTKLRAPGDPEKQTVGEFWRKLDAREYNQSNN